MLAAPSTASLPNRYAAVYPGHAMTVALFIMKAYPNASAALANSPHGGWPVCVGNSEIPGAGDGAFAGAGLISKLRGVYSGTSKETLDTCLKWATSEWKRRVGPGSGNHEKQFNPGRLQAESLEALFRQQVLLWDWS